MAIIVRCTRCSAKVRAVESVRNKTFRCPECGKKLRLADRDESARSDPLVGQKFAHYEIEEKVGEGAMASVYRARNLRLDKTVAIKILSDQATMGPLDTADRFLAEARSAASLDHTNVLSVYFVGKFDEKYFIEMQYADGGTVREALSAKGKFEVRDAARIIRDAARGLMAAHNKKIVHRDIKPQNLMLTGEGTVKVADFGLAKLQDAEKDLTAAGLVVGTPLYMSPEQVAGKQADHRSDIYSLGIAFFEMLTGRPPFDAPTPVAILHMHAYEKIPSPQLYVPELPDTICSIIAKMTRKKAEQRYADCNELIHDLDNFLAGSTVISALGAEEEIDTGVRIEVDDVNIFQTMARFAFTTGEDKERVVEDLHKKAAELHVPTEEADKIISNMAAARQAAPVISARSVEEVADELGRKATKALRRRQAEKFLAAIVRWAVVVVVVVVLIGGAHAIRSIVEKRRAAAHVRDERAEETRRIADAKKAAQEGEKLESAARWDAALKKYRESLDLRDQDDVRKRITILVETTDALALEKQEKWDEAEKALEALLPKTLAQNAIQRRIDWIKSRRQFDAAYAAAKRAYENEEWGDAEKGFRDAAELAHNIHVPTDAAALAVDAQKKMDAEAARRTKMEWLVGTCKSKKNGYALLAVCDFYLASPQYKRYRDALEKAKEQARIGIDSLKEEGPDDPIEETNNLRIVKLKKGETLYGKLLDQRDNAVEIDPIRGDKGAKRLIHVLDIDSLEPISAKEINNMRADRVVADLVSRWKAHHPFEVLQLIGKVMTRFADAKIVGSPQEQKARYGETLDDLLSKAVAECEWMCPECEGTGSIPCDECGGKGKKAVECRACKNLGRLPKCAKCRGTGLRVSGQCDECGGSGKRKCKHCKGKGCPFCGAQGVWECKACGGTGKGFTTKKCPACRGTGVLAGKECPKCFGKGKPPCPDCNGTGRATCADCNGTGEILTPCEKCGEAGRLQCLKCKGTGKREM